MNSQTTEEDLTIGRYKFARDNKGELIEIPSDLPFKSFLVYEDGKSECLRINILTTDDPTEQERFLTLWEMIRKGRNTTVFPEILDFGRDDGIPYYVSRFPHGEPLAIYLEKSPPWPGQLAARVLGRFIGSLPFQKQLPLSQHTISYDSLWVEKTIYGPRLLIGDVSATPGKNASTDNAALMLSVLKDLTKEEQSDPVISELFEKIAKGPMSIGHVEKRLKSFSIAGDSRQIDWTDQGEPTPFLEHCLAKIDQVSPGNLIEKKEAPSVKSLKKTNTGLGRPLNGKSMYRPAIELDPSARNLYIPTRFIAFFAALTIILILVCLSLFTGPGKNLFKHVAGELSDYYYQPSLVITPKPENVAIRDGNAIVGESPAPPPLNGKVVRTMTTLSVAD